MKIYEVEGEAKDSGEYLLGSQQTGSHACYIIYGVLSLGDIKRELKPGHGHEEIVLVVTGDLECSGAFSGMLRQGQAMHLRGEDSVYIQNKGTGKSVYIICGGHSGHGHH